MKSTLKVIEGIAWFDHAGYGMCLCPNGPSKPEVIVIDQYGPDHNNVLPNEWHGMKVRITMEVIDDNVSDEHKKFYDHSLWNKKEDKDDK